MLRRSQPNTRAVLSSLVLFLWMAYLCQSWISPPSFHTRHQISLCSSTSVNSDSGVATVDAGFNDSDEDDDDDDEYEYIEYDILQESEFMGSEWLVGTVMDGKSEKIQETWVRLATDKDGKNVAVWGDNAQGSWNLDVASQFLSISKENPLGKRIWAGVVNDYYFTQGTVRGWNFFSPASVLGQWQAKRLGVDPEEAGIAPWFEDDDEEEDEEVSEESEIQAASDDEITASLDSTETAPEAVGSVSDADEETSSAA